MNYHRSKLVIYIKVLVLAVLLFKNQKKLFATFYLHIDS